MDNKIFLDLLDELKRLNKNAEIFKLNKEEILQNEAFKRLDNIPIEYIEKYLRKQKLKNIEL
jgi:hypothetical protein